MNRREFINRFLTFAGVAALAPLAKLAVPKISLVKDGHGDVFTVNTRWDYSGPLTFSHQDVDLSTYLTKLTQLPLTVKPRYGTCQHLADLMAESAEGYTVFPSEIFTQEDGAFIEIIGGDSGNG